VFGAWPCLVLAVAEVVAEVPLQTAQAGQETCEVAVQSTEEFHVQSIQGVPEDEQSKAIEEAVRQGIWISTQECQMGQECESFGTHLVQELLPQVSREMATLCQCQMQ